MLTPKQLADFIIQTWAEMNPGKPSLAPRESTIVYLAEELLKDHVVLHKDNFQTLETYHAWMRSVDDRLAVMCATINMINMPRRQMKLDDSGNPSEKGRRKKIVVKIEDDEGDPNEQ